MARRRRRRCAMAPTRTGLAPRPGRGARGAGVVPVSYAFTLFEGPDWGPQLAGIAPWPSIAR
ncbi:uncharacterized protein SOCE836_039230 [Sorangium cellulosum]|uniref:Uncharacterized protein n=1 Tax=Sorangium cellulosum TaxID=56 RepID=A0A4P2QPL3_SORCE|nr:uncharacterized protein SOCE836_039230 [Sorangium cellulosum]WCQ91168.1 hypothetical protein NQZ70_03883 [Sorangium sp. Soce836]